MEVAEKAYGMSKYLPIPKQNLDLELIKTRIYIIVNLTLPLILGQRVLQVSVKIKQDLLERRLWPKRGLGA